VWGGNSYTAGSPDPSFQWFLPLFASIQAQFFGWGCVPPVNAGTVALGGWTSADLLAHVADIIALQPDHLFIDIGVNDFFAHGGTPITPAETEANCKQIVIDVRAAWPTCVVHFVAPMWSSGELWPLGSNPDDASVTATAAGIQAAAAFFGPTIAEYIDVRTDIWTNYSPILNPGNLSHGVLTQGDGVHPSKPEGMNTLSQRVFAQLKFKVP